MVAALYEDLAWHRGKVLEVKHRVEKVVIDYVDWGWRGEVRWEAVRILDHKFCALLR